MATSEKSEMIFGCFKRILVLFILLIGISTSTFAEGRKQLTLDVSIADFNHLSISWSSPRTIPSRGAIAFVQRRDSSKKFKTIKRTQGYTSGTIRIGADLHTTADYRILIRQEHKVIAASSIVTISSLPASDSVTTVIEDPSSDSGSSPGISYDLQKGESFCPAAVVRAVSTLISQYRMTLGLLPLSDNPELLQAAVMHSMAMAHKGQMTHDGWFDEVQASGYSFSYVAQNVAYGYSDASLLVNAWLASPGHRANIEHPKSVDSGVGCVIDAKGRYWWTHDMGTAK